MQRASEPVPRPSRFIPSVDDRRPLVRAGLSQPLDGLLGKVATRPTQVTDAEIAAGSALNGILMLGLLR